MTSYLKELDGVLNAAIDTLGSPASQLEQWPRSYARFCCRYPAFLDCTLSLMRRPATELQATISDSVWLRLGQGMALCINHVSRLLRAADHQGILTIPDPDYTTNVLWTQMLGTMRLARLRVGLRQAAPGVPALFSISPDRVFETCIANALTTAGVKH